MILFLKLHSISFAIKIIFFNFGKLYLKKSTHRIGETLTLGTGSLHHKPSSWQAALFRPSEGLGLEGSSRSAFPKTGTAFLTIRA